MLMIGSYSFAVSRTKEEEEKDVKMYRKKGRNQEKKQRVLVSYYE